MRRTTAVNDVVYRVVVRVARLAFRLLGLRLDVRGAEHVPASGPAVLAANHQSFVDFLVVGVPAVDRGRLVRFMAKQAVFRWPVASPLMRAMRHIPVDRRSGAAAARTAARALARGEVVGVYPEATVGHAFALKDRADLKDGAAFLALRTGAPLVPVAHWGLHRVSTVGPRWSLRRGRWVGVVVGEPLSPRPGETPAELTGRLHEALRSLVEELLDRYPDPPSPPTAAWWWPAHRGGGAPQADAARELDRLAVEVADAPRGSSGLSGRSAAGPPRSS
ncbi:1-acyl-sn-glycerol-3-phosphate acyltransferase [Phycicoccus sp. CSK15P-2]|uniref:lysophospholipid acyltransferase family protein n=1 Tax=Phycicoccus sp. CSK15P-2 TaxID=2807627 RepID=UPI0019506FB1|nr:lysophospholipid acyltransferase family protein [Phycicoccus sp. CSK15P-2]MBM6403945.1 1-acyl-sn-glycerol-3-phosphate acyltransferase [Phycicoccus sp. CSK15P-2]